MKDCQLMMQFYDLDHGGSLQYNEFMKFILPCDNTDIRADACQRKTYKADIVNGKKLHESVEKGMAEFFERELNCHIKIGFCRFEGALAEHLIYLRYSNTSTYLGCSS